MWAGIDPITLTIATVWMFSALDVILRAHNVIVENVALLAVFIVNGRTKLSNMMVKIWSLRTRIYQYDVRRNIETICFFMNASSF